MATEIEDHYSSERNHWCIVMYINSTPLYYTGWFGKNINDDIMKPAMSTDFESALKLHSKIAAQTVLNGLQSCSKSSGLKIEDHMWCK